MVNEKSDCKWADDKLDPTGLFWCNCDKISRMVNGEEKPTCEHYEKE